MQFFGTLKYLILQKNKFKSDVPNYEGGYKSSCTNATSF